MSEAPADVQEPDEDTGSPIPDPPRRVPFGIAVTACLLGLLSVFLLVTTVVIVAASTASTDGMGEALAEGVGAAVIGISAALVAAIAWSFVRDGRTVGPMIVGCVVLLGGLAALGTGVVGEEHNPGLLRLSMFALTLGLGVLLVPLLGHGPAYLAARQVWSRAERDWLHEMAAPEPVVHQQQYPPQPQWGHPPQPTYPPQYQYPPQQTPGWGAPPPHQQHQAWPDPAAQPLSAPPAQPYSAPPGQHFSAPPAQPYSAPPGQHFSAPPAQPFSAPPAQSYSATVAQQDGVPATVAHDEAQAGGSSPAGSADRPPAPHAAAQQAPTEYVSPPPAHPPHGPPH